MRRNPAMVSYPPREFTGASMRLDVYSVAYEEANSELIGITQRFEQLRRRKVHLESVVAALAPMLGVEVSSRPVAQESNAPSPKEPQPSPDPANYTFNQVAAPLPDLDETGGDPFQRRVRNALKLNRFGQEHQGLQPAV
jgi:hypothetical protein